MASPAEVKFLSVKFNLPCTKFHALFKGEDKLQKKKHPENDPNCNLFDLAFNDVL